MNNELKYGELDELIKETINILSSKPPIINIEDKTILVVGDIHGDYESVDAALRIADKDNVNTLLFLGDYVDRGDKSVEVLHTLMTLISDNSFNLIILRGDHETREINSEYGFLEELKNKFPEKYGEIYDLFNELFAQLPYVAYTKYYVFLHGGIPRGVSGIKDLKSLRKGLISPSPGTIEFEILWNDPAEYINGYIPNIRGDGTYLFGVDVTMDFLNNSGLTGIIRGHDPPPYDKGYYFSHNNHIVTINTCRFISKPVILEVYGDEYEIIYI